MSRPKAGEPYFKTEASYNKWLKEGRGKVPGAKTVEKKSNVVYGVFPKSKAPVPKGKQEWDKWAREAKQAQKDKRRIKRQLKKLKAEMAAKRK